MKKLGILFIAALLIFSCKDGVIEKPDHLIEKHKMEDILYQLALLNAARSIPIDEFGDGKIALAPYVYEEFKIDSAQFAQSSMYYASKPDEQLEIYKNVEKRLEKFKDEIKEQNDKENKKRDSIIKAKSKKLKEEKKAIDTLKQQKQ